jgi:flagellar biosynthesis protein FlhF
MQLKTYRAPTIRQALDLVKRELGEDAIILGNRKIAVSETETQVEVTAAVEQMALSAPPQEMFGDIREIKDLLSLLISSKDYFARLQLEEPVNILYHSLLARGLDEKHCFVLLKKVLTELKDSPVNRQKVVEHFGKLLLDRIRFSRPFSNHSSVKHGQKVFAFVGPTGVGKTTTLAKLAAHVRLKRGLRVGLISLDTYRIGAVDQLRTYANILGLPMMVAQNKQEFGKALASLGNQDVVLVDTIGKNFLASQQVQDLQQTFSDSDNVQHFLVLSATAKDEDLKQTVQHFRPLSVHSLIFTKLDETSSHGCVINQLIRFPHAVSYFGTGQRVPEDIELATQKRLLALLFPFGNGSVGKE